MKNREYFALSIITIILGILIAWVNILPNKNFLLLDSFVVKPIGEIIIDNVGFDKVPFSGLGLNQFYFFTAIYKVITNINWFDLTRYLWMFIFVLFLLSLIVFSSKVIHKKFIPIYLFFIITSTMAIKRFAITQRENIALIPFILLLSILLEDEFDKKYSLVIPALLFAFMVGANPITISVFSIFIFIYLGCLLFFNVDNKREKVIYILKFLIIGAAISIYYIIQFVGSIFWQMKYVEDVVIKVRNVKFSYYYANLSQFSIGIVAFALFGTILFFFKRGNKAKDIMILSLTATLLFLYVISFFPKSGLFQDRLLIYFYILLSLYAAMFVDYLSNVVTPRRLVFIIFLVIMISITKILDFKIWAPYGNINMNEISTVMSDSKTQIICFGFDDDVIKYIKYDYCDACQKGEVAKQLLDIDSIEKLKTYVNEHYYGKNKIYIFFSQDTYYQTKAPLKDLLIRKKLIYRNNDSRMEAFIEL